jgi:hypothetical protein
MVNRREVLPGQPNDPNATHIVMASQFRVRRRRDVGRFLADSMRIFRQACMAEGAVSVSLIAHPLRREFLTLSAWSSRAALDELVGAQPHSGAMRRQRPVMEESTFIFWSVSPGEDRVTWEDARRRLTAERARRGGD